METLLELFAGKEQNEYNKLYAKMFMIELDIRYNRVIEEDYNFFNQHFEWFILYERKLIEEANRYEEWYEKRHLIVPLCFYLKSIFVKSLLLINL